MVRLSTFAVSTLVPALKVLSTFLPDSTLRSLVRTNAGPLPGLTCWNSTTAQSWPSMLRTMPFFRSLVVAMRACASSMSGVGGCPGGERRGSRQVYTRSVERPHHLDSDRQVLLAGPDRHRFGQCRVKGAAFGIAVLEVGVVPRLGGPDLLEAEHLPEILPGGVGVLPGLLGGLLDGKVASLREHLVPVADAQVDVAHPHRVAAGTDRCADRLAGLG